LDVMVGLCTNCVRKLLPEFLSQSHYHVAYFLTIFWYRCHNIYYLWQRYIFCHCLSVCLSVSKITQKCVHGFGWNVACRWMSEHGRTS